MAERPSPPKSREALELARANPRNVNETRYWMDQYARRRRIENKQGASLARFNEQRGPDADNVDGLADKFAALNEMARGPGRPR
jgi:hypothetical protein